MSYSDLLKPRRDVLSEDGIEGIIDLANIDDPKKRKIESRPQDFFVLTYPTADARRVIETIQRRYSGDRDAPGLFLFEGLKGSGKSHLLLLAYHLFVNPGAGQEWLSRHQLQCRIPQNPIVVINKFTDLPLYSIWDFIFTRLTGKSLGKTRVQPSLEEVSTALGDRHLVLILDELEQGIRVISDPAVQAQNLAFLQMLSEWGNRENKVTLFASIYSDQVEPGSTLKRVPCCRIRFEHSQDKPKVVLHRLFENYLEMKPESARPTIESYLSTWRRHGAVRGDELDERLQNSFPFSPDVLEVILERVPARGGFQNVRGALGFLARLVKLTHTRTDLITPAHADLMDPEVSVRLQDLDPSGDLIRKARGNLKELSSFPQTGELGATAMLYTLSGSGRDCGATREQLLRAVCDPATNINDFEQALLTLQRYGSHFHVREGRYFFDPEENADAKVEYRSLAILEDRAKELVRGIWLEESFRETQAATVLVDVEQAKATLGAMETRGLRFVLSPRRLKPEERHLLYHGLAERNQTILLEPRDSKVDVTSNRDFIKWAQRLIAARDLKNSPQDDSREAEYERIENGDKASILAALRRISLFYLRPEGMRGITDEEAFVEESLGNAVSKEDIVQKLNQEFFPTQTFVEDILRRFEDLRGHAMKDVDRDYRTILGLPVPTHETSVSKAIRALCKEGRIGVLHPRGDFSGQDPDLTENELLSATLGAPFEKARSTQSLFPGQTPKAHPPGEAPGAPEITVMPPPANLTRDSRDQTQEIVIPPQASPGALRQQLASRLQAFEEAVVNKARFTVFLEFAGGDLSSLPQALRGSLSGSGSLTAEITIAREAVGGKGDAEQLAEELPNLPGASYSARIEVVVPKK